jgi:Fe-S-cluster containining protein
MAQSNGGLFRRVIEMVGSAWDVKRFGSELTAALTDTLAGEVDAASLSRAVTKCAAAAEAVCGERPIACAAGCPHCCVLNVSILLSEGMIIADWLRERLPPTALAALRGRLAAHCRRVRWMEDDERITKQVACPLLDADGNCTIHPVRPLVCRAVASFDRTSCREAFNPAITDEERLVSADLLRQTLFDEAFMAQARALLHRGLDDRSIELGSGVLAFLEHPELREKLFSGERLPAELWQ